MKTIGVFTAVLVSGLVLMAAPSQAQLELHGFVEVASGFRLNDPGALPAAWVPVPADFIPPEAWSGEKDYTLRESRVQLKGDLWGDVGEAHFVVDLLADQVTGTGTDLALREGYVKFNAFSDHLEVRAGRQPTTWGTGDLLFINDLFPKDYVSYFAGREDQYLKSPSDVVRLGVFGLPVVVDLVVTPKFSPDQVPSGERLVFWSPAFVPATLPSEEVENGELALRVSRYVGSINLAFYGYRGFWKSPMGATVAEKGESEGEIMGFFHPELSSYGASARGGLFGGVGWVEGAYYDSRDDSEGDNPLVPNSELRGLAGYERQWWGDFTGGAQIYWEGVEDYVESEYVKDENRTLLTLRLTQLMRYQTLKLSGFGYWSPTDEDSYVRLVVGYDYTDEINLTLGANIFGGSDSRTPFGMNEDNSNLYARVRFNF